MDRADKQADERQDAGWLPPPADLKLDRGEVQVWRARLEPSPPLLSRLHAVLNPEEREKAARFVFPIHRERYVIARGVLRHILARYLPQRPSELIFEQNSYGKPSLRADVSGGAGPHFNVSHSGGLALYAFSRDAEIGVDVEEARGDFATEDIAENFFSPREVRAFRETPPGERVEAFFNCWTRKEAYIKALGKGLSHPLDCFAVSLTPGLPARLLSDETDPAGVGDWTLLRLPIDTGYAAALAIRKRGLALKLYDWQPPTAP